MLDLHIPDLHLGEDEGTWVPYADGVSLRYRMFDLREGTWANVLRTKGPDAPLKGRNSAGRMTQRPAIPKPRALSA